MTIKRFTLFKDKNEDTILDECGYPKALSLEYDLRFCKEDDSFVFIFAEETDLEWIVKPDAFSMKIEGSINKTMLVPEIEGKSFVVFVIETGKKDYTFYGIFKLINPYTEEDGVGKVIDAYSPLEFCLECGDYVL